MRGTFEEPPTILIPWFSKTEGNTYATIVASPFPLQGKPTQAQHVAAPQVGGYKFTKVLMDGGSSINILYYETFRRMGLTDKSLKQSNTVFHDVVPGKSVYPVGKIELEVAFGDEYDSRAEKLTFEISCSVRTAGLRQVHGSAVLCVIGSQDAGL